ncbi:hypothetical protein C8K36_101920 [Rhodococcus sp. OK519]|nr:hypothetical protein C8K36_101920 [Rhodococcus sp. OK519]
MVARDTTTLVLGGNLGLPTECASEGENPCGGRHFQQSVRCEPQFHAAEPEGVERDGRLVDFGDGGHPQRFEALDFAGEVEGRLQQFPLGQAPQIAGVHR